MMQILAGLMVAAVYVAAFVALVRGPGVKPRHRLHSINTNTKEGRMRFIREAARLAKQAEDHDGID